MKYFYVVLCQHYHITAVVSVSTIAFNAPKKSSKQAYEVMTHVIVVKFCNWLLVCVCLVEFEMHCV